MGPVLALVHPLCTRAKQQVLHPPLTAVPPYANAFRQSLELFETDLSDDRMLIGPSPYRVSQPSINKEVIQHPESFTMPRPLVVKLLVLLQTAALVTLVASFSSAADTTDGKVFTQTPEIAPAVSPGSTTPSTPAKATEAPSTAREKLMQGPAPSWIWGKDPDQRYTLKIEFDGGSTSAWIKALCDNEATIRINKKTVLFSQSWSDAQEDDVQKAIKKGKNVLSAEVRNQGGQAGFSLKLAMVMPDGSTRYIVTDKSWIAAESADATEWAEARVVGKMGMAPWGDGFAKPSSKADLPRDVFNLPQGFQVERLFTVPKETLGSWVSITQDDKGRLIVSDQGGLGLCRVTPPPIGSTEPTKVERLNVKMTSAHGLLHAFGSLYVMANGGPGSGLYRLKDTDGDDQYDEVVKLKDIRGGGEHGPHGIRLSPDGKSIYCIGGNHTPPPIDIKRNAPVQTMGGIRSEQLRAELSEGQTSRIVPNWDEDVLLPRQWDGNGHATGILAPGGWIAKTDPDGKTWEMISVGYRNQYDMAFNADGELFAYDSDMEWDMGTPWYRATRLTHATSGSEFGWRSGTADWPWYYADSLPPLIDIGPGSPVGVEFGYGTKFPAKYQRALYLCDWTFGTMYAIHLEPDGASYKAVKEEFVSRTPLPLTDAVVGRDGALYFTVGGRGAQSELYRVTYIGKESTAPVDAHDSQFAELRDLRHKIESYHGPVTDTAKAVEFLAPYLGHADQYIRYAARVALERIPVELWQDHVFNAHNPETIITGAIGLARQGDRLLLPKLLTTLGKLEFTGLTELQQLALLRAYQLTFIRLGLPDDSTLAALGTKFDALFPTPSELVNRELAIVMVGVSSPNAAHKLVPLLTKERVMSQKEIGEVLLRNKGYGGSIAAMLANQPDQMQLHLALTLRNLKKGWTLDEKKTYFSWYEKAHTWNGGNSYQKFLINFDKEAYENSTDVERLAVESTGARKPYKMPELPKPRGPGKDYSLDELLALSTTHMKGRDFNNGRRMYSAARCVVCHRFGGDGGATGPDLTQLAGRFNFKDLTEAIVDPSKVVSDLYKTTIVQTSAGKSYTGRVVSAAPESITLLIDPEDATKIITLKKSEIDEQMLSPISLMPKDLLKTLNQDEVLDLLAYLLSRGNQQDPMFRK
jgi:putative heme-binding domain-containing protein